MKISRVFPLLFLCILFSACETTQQTKTPLELQAFQRKEFPTNRKVAFASTLSVFQDLGYVVKAADLETGLITAQSPTKNFVLFGSHMSSVEATAFVEEFAPTKSSVRLNFVKVNESSSGYGMKSKKDTPVEDPAIYENAFQRIQQAIFIRTNLN